MTATLKSPFPYFGGKSRITDLVWERFATVDNYVEPFFGSGALLLGCPWPGHTETVNDADGLLANFFRALQLDPDAVAYYADWPVNEADLHARHRWLVDRRSLVEELMQDPDWYDARAAGWWVWGISQWIGTGWCPRVGAAPDEAPHLGNAGQGVNRQMPELSGDSGATGHGVHAQKHSHKVATKDGKFWNKRPSVENNGVHRKMPHAGDAGRGVHRAQHLSQQVPELGHDRGVAAVVGQSLGHRMPFILGIHGITHAGEGALYDYFRALAARLRRVRVVCGDFERILGPPVTWRHGTTAVFLDPPYADAEHAIEYSGGGAVWGRVTAWCETNGDHPLLRIALCGYEGTWTPPAGWEAIKWRAPGGYGSQGQGRGRANAAREVVWFSPNCLTRIEDMPLFRDAP